MNSRISFIRFILLFVFFISLSSIFNLSFANEGVSGSKNLASKAVEEFCQLEFQYDSNRDKLMKMSESYEDKIDKLSGSVETLHIPDVYEVFAIKSYKILDVTVSSNKAIATVSYDILAKRTGWIPHNNKQDGTYYGEAVFMEYVKPNYIEKINLIFEGGRWLVLDPPFPKISIDKVVGFYEKELDWYKVHRPEAEVGKAIPHIQKRYDEDKRNLDLLKRLASS